MCVCEFVGWVGGDTSYKIQALKTRFWTCSSPFKANNSTETTWFHRIYKEQRWSESVPVCQDPPFLSVGKDVGGLSHSLLMEGGGNTIPHGNKKAALWWTDTWTGINKVVGREWISQSRWRQRKFSDTGSHPLSHSTFSWSLWYLFSSSHKNILRQYQENLQKWHFQKQINWFYTQPVMLQSVHACQASPRSPELFVWKWSLNQNWSLEIMEPNQRLGICSFRFRDKFTQAMEHEELYGHDWDYFKNNMYLSVIL